MKLKAILFAAAAAVLSFSACENKDENLGTPDISISTNEMSFEIEGGSQELIINATRDWTVESDAAWVRVSPDSGPGSTSGQTVTVTVLNNSVSQENPGMDRSADLKFTIGMKSKYLTVSQAGPGGSAEALVVYSNNFDKEEATKTYGSGSSWPYLNQFDGWKNATGSGAANVTYSFKGMSARANSTSDGEHSDYAGSGKNNMFFGSSAYLATNNIALNGATGLTLTFGTEKYSQDNGSIFTNSEFHIFLSQDGAKWVELTDYTFAGGTTEGRWNVATADFSVPEGTENLSICMQVDVASSYRMDDMKLVISEGGAAVDFTKGAEVDFTAGGSTTAPESKGKKTVDEFIVAADTQNYYELTGTVSGFNPTYCSFDLIDATGTIYVYSVLDASKAEWTSKISNGGTITIYGKYLYYEDKSQHEVVDAYIVSYTPGEVEDPTTVQLITCAEFIEKADPLTTYRLVGEVTSDVNTTYCSFDMNDGSATVVVWTVNNKDEWKSIVKKGGTVTVRGKYKLYGDKHEMVDAYIEVFEAGEGGDDSGGQGGDVTPPAGDGEYEPQGITWTLGSSAYDNTSTGTNAQTATVNGVAVSNLLKLGTGSKVGNATLHIPAGTIKIGFYCVAWKGKTASVKFSVDGTEITTITPAANVGATGNPPYTALEVADSDYYEVEVSATEAIDVKVETLDSSNGRVLFVGLRAITE